MRGVDHQQSGMFSYISAERRVPKDHPLRAIRVMVDAALKESSWRFDAVYASSGRPSIRAGEAAARAAVAGAVHGAQRAAVDGAARLQLPVSLVCGAQHRRSGLGRDGLHQEPGALAGGRGGAGLFQRGGRASGCPRACSPNEHFTVDGTLIEAWAGHKSFKRKGDDQQTPPDDPGNPSVNFHGERRTNATHQSTTDPRPAWPAKGRAKRPGSATPGHVQMDNRHGLVVNTRLTQASGIAEPDGGFGDGGRDRGPGSGHAGRRQGLRSKGVGARIA